MKLSIFNSKGEDSGKKVTLKPEIFEVQPSQQAIYQSVRLVSANSRQGTHLTKGRSFVSGGGKKPFKQKGTGNARQGTIRAPHMVGGGRVFGPEPRDYGFKLNKKVKSLARKSALSMKASENNIVILGDFKLTEPKTKVVMAALKALKLDSKKVLILSADNDAILHKSSRNIPAVEVVEARNVTAYQLLNADAIVIQENAVEKLNEVLA